MRMSLKFLETHLEDSGGLDTAGSQAASCFFGVLRHHCAGEMVERDLIRLEILSLICACAMSRKCCRLTMCRSCRLQTCKVTSWKALFCKDCMSQLLFILNVQTEKSCNCLPHLPEVQRVMIGNVQTMCFLFCSMVWHIDLGFSRWLRFSHDIGS